MRRKRGIDKSPMGLLTLCVGSVEWHEPLFFCYKDSMKPFEQSIEIHFRQTDMAGVTYFNEVFNIFHDVYENWVGHIFADKKKWFANEEWVVPLRSVACDYRHPLQPFQSYIVRMTLNEIGKSSFQLSTEIASEKSVHAIITTAHVFVNKATGRSQEIPVALKTKMENFKKD
jgi:1,4-dihydroxy-2-naphthoyl-CoA hydrolase